MRANGWGDSWGRSVQPQYFAAGTNCIVFCSIMHSGVKKQNALTRKYKYIWKYNSGDIYRCYLLYI